MAFTLSLDSLHFIERARANWNPAADLAPPYGIISLTDLVTLGMHYGQHNP